jgi:hypothetical protein
MTALHISYAIAASRGWGDPFSAFLRRGEPALGKLCLKNEN